MSPDSMFSKYEICYLSEIALCQRSKQIESISQYEIVLREIS